jgi:hypothetical protein
MGLVSAAAHGVGRCVKTRNGARREFERALAGCTPTALLRWQVMPAVQRKFVFGAELGEGSAVHLEEHRDARGTIRLWRQRDGRLYSTRVTGHLSIALAHRIIEYVDPMFEAGRVLGFHDWFQMSSYDTSSRNELTAWSLRRSSLAQINIGTRAKLVSMGVTVAALALGAQVLRRFGNEAALEAAYQQALRLGEASSG